MEYVYAAMLLHSAENEINEKNVNAVLKSAGVKADDARVKALCASLEGVDIGEAMTSAVAVPLAYALAAKTGSLQGLALDGLGELAAGHQANPPIAQTTITAMPINQNRPTWKPISLPRFQN